MCPVTPRESSADTAQPSITIRVGWSLLLAVAATSSAAASLSAAAVTAAAVTAMGMPRMLETNCSPDDVSTWLVANITCLVRSAAGIFDLLSNRLSRMYLPVYKINPWQLIWCTSRRVVSSMLRMSLGTQRVTGFAPLCSTWVIGKVMRVPGRCCSLSSLRCTSTCCGSSTPAAERVSPGAVAIDCLSGAAHINQSFEQPAVG